MCIDNWNTGQDGSFLAEYLLGHGVEVWGLHRRTSTPNFSNIQHLLGTENFNLIEGDLTDLSSLIAVIHRVEPDCICQSCLTILCSIILDSPFYRNLFRDWCTSCLEVARIVNSNIQNSQLPHQRCSGHSPPTQDENTPLLPNSPYGSAKVFAHHTARTTEKHTICSFPVVSCSIMNQREGECSL